MIRISHFFILGAFLFISACISPSQPELAASAMPQEYHQDLINDPEPPEKGEEVTVNLDGKLELVFKVEDLWTDRAYLQQIHHDTIYLMLGLVENISGHNFQMQLQDDNIRAVTVFQRYETSLSLMDEGPHFDLTDWKHYISEWEELPVKSLSFTSAIYGQYHYQRFPEVTPAEILEAVKSRVNHSDRWTDLARRCNDPFSYPCGVSISRYYLKIRMTEENNHTSEMIVVFDVPMGC